MNCHLLVPDLFWPAAAGDEPYRGLALPELETLLGRGRRMKTSGASLERWLAGRYHLTDGLPLAPFSLRGDGGEPGADCWMRADPVHLRLHGDRLILADASRLAVTPDEAREFIAALNSHFAGDGISIALGSGMLAAKSLQGVWAGETTVLAAAAAYRLAYERAFRPAFRAGARRPLRCRRH